MVMAGLVITGMLDYTLQRKYDPYWTQPEYKSGGARDALRLETLSESILADLLNSHDPERWARADQRPLVKEVLARRLRAWAEESASEGERLLVGGLRRDPAALAHKLT